MTDKEKTAIFAGIANGESLMDACKVAGIPVREAVEAVVTDAAFAAAVVAAQNERGLRNWRGLLAELGRIESATAEAAANALSAYSAVEDLGPLLAANDRTRP